MLLVVNPQEPDVALHRQPLRQAPADSGRQPAVSPLGSESRHDRHRHLPQADSRCRSFRRSQDRHLGDQIDMCLFQRLSLGDQSRSDVDKFLAGAETIAQGSAGTGRPRASRTRRNRPSRSSGPSTLPRSARSTGLTYLWQPVLAGNPAYFDLQVNHYMRLPIAEQRDAQTVGFRGNRLYNRKGEVVGYGRPAILPLDDAGRHRRPRQLAGRGARLPPAQRRGRRHASERDDLFRQERRHPLESPPRALSRRP